MLHKTIIFFISLVILLNPNLAQSSICTDFDDNNNIINYDCSMTLSEAINKQKQEQQREEQERIKEQKRIEEQKRREEQKQREEQERIKEQKRIEEQKQREEQERIKEQKRIEEQKQRENSPRDLVNVFAGIGMGGISTIIKDNYYINNYEINGTNTKQIFTTNIQAQAGLQINSQVSNFGYLVRFTYNDYSIDNLNISYDCGVGYTNTVPLEISGKFYFVDIGLDYMINRKFDIYAGLGLGIFYERMFGNFSAQTNNEETQYIQKVFLGANYNVAKYFTLYLEPAIFITTYDKFWNFTIGGKVVF